MPLKDDIERILPDQLVRNLAQRKLLLGVALFVCFLVVLLIALGSLLGHCSGTTRWLQGGPGECRSPPCLRTAGLMADNADLTVSPCEDFYTYACGGWGVRHAIPPDESESTRIGHLEDEIDEKLREIIEKIPEPGTAGTSSAEGKLQLFFRSCVHDYGRMRDGGRTLVQLILSSLRGWYVLSPSDWNAQWDFQQALTNVQADLLVSVLFETRLDKNYTTNQYMLGIYYSGIGIQAFSYYQDRTDQSAARDAYQDYMRRVAELLLRDANVTIPAWEQHDRIEQFVSDVYGMEEALSAMVQNERQQGRLYQRLTTSVGQLQINYSQFDWQPMLTRMFDNLAVSADTVVRLSSPGYFVLLNELIRNETDAHVRDRVLNNYMVWRIMYKYASDLSWEYREAGYRYQEALYGDYEWPPTWRTCLDTIRYRLGSLLAIEFIKAHLGTDAKSQVTEMYNNIASAVKQRITELPWMDNVTMTRALEKVNSIKPSIGFPEAYYNSTLMDDMHTDLDITPGASYFSNLLSVNRFQRRNRVRLFVSAQENTMDHLPLLGHSAHYWITPYLMSYYNMLLVPAGAMLEPLYNSKRPQVFNYGILGTLIAGELLSAVDETGRWVQANGSYSDWWTPNTFREYKKTTECFERYFEQLTAGPFLVNGENRTVPVNGVTQVYRLMDNLGGIRAAYRSYNKWKKESGNADPIPAGLDWTSDQTFFVSAVQTKCYLRTDELEYQYAMARFLPENMEVNSLLSHMPEFTAAFNCPLGSAMRETYQCETF